MIFQADKNGWLAFSYVKEFKPQALNIFIWETKFIDWMVVILFHMY